MCSAAALHIFSGKIILNRATPGGLRTARCGVFTGGAGAVSGRKNPLRLAMLASSPEGGASDETEKFANKLGRFPLLRKKLALRESWRGAPERVVLPENES